MTKPNKPILSVRDLKTIRDSRVIHNGVNLDLYAGEVLVLLGESGSGKTLLLRTLVGLETPDAGTCLFEGRDLFKIAHNEWPKVRLKIAYAFQGGALFDSLTVRENLEFPLREHTRMTAKERQNRVAAQLDELGLGRIEDLYNWKTGTKQYASAIRCAALRHYLALECSQKGCLKLSASFCPAIFYLQLSKQTSWRWPRKLTCSCALP